MSGRCQRTGFTRILAAGVLGGIFLGAHELAWPQEPACFPSPAEEVFTARNCQENLLEVPLSIAALSGARLTEKDARTLQDVELQTPGLIVHTESGSEANTRQSIGGFAAGGGDSSFALLDAGAFIDNPSATNIALMNIEGVEVAKGPVNSLSMSTGGPRW